jgi:hypothetical protein
MYEVITGKTVPKCEVIVIFSAIIDAMILWCSNENISNYSFLKSLHIIQENIRWLVLVLP